MSKVKERILKVAREKPIVIYKRNTIISRFFSRNFAGQKRVTPYIQSTERRKPPTKNTLPEGYHSELKKRESFPDKSLKRS